MRERDQNILAKIVRWLLGLLGSAAAFVIGIFIHNKNNNNNKA